LYISFSLLVYFIVCLLGKNQKIGVWKFGHVEGLREKVRPSWKRQIAQQVSAVSEQCAVVFGGKALVDLGIGGGGAVAAQQRSGNGFSRGDERLKLNPLFVGQGHVVLHEWV